jgi:hypothetical protein
MVFAFPGQHWLLFTMLTCSFSLQHIMVQPKKWSRDGFPGRMGLVMIYGMAKATKSRLRRFRDSLYVLLVFLVAFPAFIELDSWLLPDYFPRVTQRDASYLAHSIRLSVILVQAAVIGLVVFVLLRRRTTEGKLRWYQYSLRSLLILVTLCALPCSWLAVKMQQAKRQQEAGRAIEEMGGRVTYYSDSIWLPRFKLFDKVGSVSLNGPSATDAVLTSLMPSLKELKFNQCSLTASAITDAGMAHLSELTQVECLALNMTAITDVALVHITGLTQLKQLFLDHTKITDAGLGHLTGLNELRWLYLDDTQITDAGLEHLKGLDQLQDLGLRNTKITDVGLQHLTRLNQLVKLSLDGTEVTGEGIAKLRQALPRCQITGPPK